MIMNNSFHMRDQNHEPSIVWHPLWMENCEKSVILNECFSSVFTKENINSISHPEQVFKGDTKERLLDVDVSHLTQT